MKKFCQIIDNATKQCHVGLGTDTEYYKKIGMIEANVEQCYDGSWYLYGYAPKEPLESLIKKAKEKRDELIKEVEWRINRYRDQTTLKLETNDSKEDYIKLLKYVQELRDVPAQEGFPKKIIWPTLE